MTLPIPKQRRSGLPRFISSFMIAMSLCTATVLSSGCSSTGRVQEGGQPIDSMRDVQAQLAVAKAEVTRVNVALDGLAISPDMQKAFLEYSNGLTDLQSEVANLKARAADLHARRVEYLDRWQQEAADVQNPDVKSSMDQRRQKVADDFDKVRGLGDDALAEYEPYLQDCLDIKKALAIDLTTAGVQALSRSIAKARTEGDTVNQKVDVLSAELDSLIGKMSPATAAPAK